MRRRRRTALAGTCAVVAASGVLPLTAAHAQGDRPGTRHVLLLSVDGMHQADLARYVTSHPHSALAALARRGTSFSHASTPIPSDSFPGMVGQVTGGNPGTTGVYYDDSYNHALLPAGTTSCTGVAPGTEVTYFEQLDKDPNRLDAGQGLTGLPGSILHMTGQPRDVIDPTQLPVDPATCRPVYPHSYLQVNTVFEVLRAHGLRTAWSDKHAAYDILQGPSGAGIADLFTPEINSMADPSTGADWTADNASTQRYDGYKAQAVLNEIDGYDHSRTSKVGMPALLGMNFQSVSTAEKLPTSGGVPGGYGSDGTPGPVLSSALAFVDREVGAMVTELRKRHKLTSTTIILSAKHGQSPVEPAALTRIPDGPILDGLNAAWVAAGHPQNPPLVAQATNDDAMIMWLSDRSQSAADFAKNYLLAHDGTGNGIDGQPKPYTASGLKTVYAGQDAAALFGTAVGDPRVPDLFAFAQHGVVFTGKKGKIAEHGGADPQDLNVPLLVAGPHSKGTTDAHPVETTDIAPTILRLLGLSPRELQAVQREGTPVLPLDN